jgi:type II secretory pathway pseudopilin PulG
MISIPANMVKHAWIPCLVLAALLIPSMASAQIDPGLQAAQQAQQTIQLQQQQIIASQTAQQANEQMLRSAQQSSQASLQASQQTPGGTNNTRGNAKIAKPIFSPRPGVFLTPVNVTIRVPATQPLEIYYTLDGSEPTTSSTRYDGPILVSTRARLRAIAISHAKGSSRIVSAKYIVRK